LPKFEPF